MKNRRLIMAGLVIAVVAAIIGAMALGGCGLRRARSVEYRIPGRYYSLLKPGEKGEGLRVYKNPKADWRSYDKIILDPVQIWRTKSAKEEGAPIEDLQRVANNFHLILTKELSKDYTMVTDPTTAGPRTLRIQTALTSMEKGGGVMDNITAIVPIGLGIAAAADFITGKPPFVGEVAAEVKIIDARTGQLLAAAVDKRIGGKDIAKLVDSWDDVNKILNLWSKLLAFRLCEARGGQNCLPPV
jgi:hypothetical protein